MAAAASTAVLAADHYFDFIPETNDQIAFSDFISRAKREEFSDIYVTENKLTGKTVSGDFIQAQTTLTTEENLSLLQDADANIWLQSGQNSFQKWARPAATTITASLAILAGKSLFNDLNKPRWQAQFKEMLHKEQIQYTAYHEAGHALVGLANPGIYSVGEATIKPEPGMFGYVDAMDRTKIKSATKERLENTIAMLMAGRAAEQIVFGDNQYGTGARADIDMAKKIAMDMVLNYGMSEELGNAPHLPSIFDSMRPLQFLFMTSAKKRQVNLAVKKILNQGLKTAKSVIEEHKIQFDSLAAELLKKERLSPKEVREASGLFDPDDHLQFEGFTPPTKD